MNEEPLIWTTKGNIPMKDLEYRTGWVDTEDFISFNEVYLLDGEIVKSSTHAYKKQGLSLLSELQSI